MTKIEFAKKLYLDLKEKQDVQKIVNSIKSVKYKGKNLSIDEQLEIIDLIKKIHIEDSRCIFEDVSDFLILVNQVESKIKKQNEPVSEGSK